MKNLRYPVVLAALIFSTFLQAQDDPEISKVNGNVWLISGGGYANVSVLAGNDRALLVDSKQPDDYETIRAMIRQVSGGDTEFLINGHVHPDHTDGNANFGNAGAVIIAHEEVRRVLMAGQRGGPPAPAAALPAITIGDAGSMTIHFDGETVHIMHMPPAHTAGNLLVWFEQSNVLHVGDLSESTRYPVIAGGTIDGFIEANNRILALADDDTRIITGIGPVTDRKNVEAFRNMLVTVKNRIARLIAEGKSLEEVTAAKPTEDFDAAWGNPSRFLPAVYRNLASE